jgi:hypothetical protein
VAAPALIGQQASYEETGPYIDGLSTALAGYRTAGAANTAGDLPTGTQVIVTAFKTGAYANFLVWQAQYDHANTRFSRVAALASGGTIADEDALDIYVSDGGQLLTNVGEVVKAHGTLSGNATLDVAEGHVHTVTIDADRTLTLENTQGHTGTGLTLIITKGANTITWAGDFNGTTGWIGGAPNISAADTYVIFFHWLGSASTCYAIYGGAL